MITLHTFGPAFGLPEASPFVTPDALAARVLAQEHRIYPLALKLVAGGATRVEGARVLTKSAASPPEPLLWPAG